MKLVKQSFEILEQTDYSLKGIKQFIERCGRVCYKSEDKITDTSYEKFVDMLERKDHCYNGNTEVMTENGWVKWKDYKGEKVAVVNPDFTFKGFEIPSRIINKNYTGNFYYYPSLGTTVTEGHTMYGCFLSNRENTYEKFICNKDFYDQNKRHWTMGERPFRVKTVPNKPNSTNPIYELIGFWLGDGCVNNNVNQLTFHLKKERKIKYLKELADKIGYEFKVRKGNYYCIVYNNIGKYFNTNFVKNKIKYINLKLSPSEIHSVIVGLINSDGKICNPTTKKKNVYFSTTSRYIKKWLLTWSPLAGYTISEGKPTNCYNFTFRTKNVELCNDSRNLERTKVHIFFNSMQVYCVTVSTGLLLLRGDNGKSFICGNCRPLEFGTVHLLIPESDFKEAYASLAEIGLDNCDWLQYCYYQGSYYVTTNYRYYLDIIKSAPSIQKYFSETYSKYYPKRYTVHFIIGRAIMDEFRTHVTLSHLAESTRYCNYSKNKFNNVVTFVIPNWCKSLVEGSIQEYSPFEINTDEVIFMNSIQNAQNNYLSLLKAGWTPQQAREVLPLSVKSELISCGFEDAWSNFFYRRCAKDAHPMAREIAIPLQERFKLQEKSKELSYVNQ